MNIPTRLCLALTGIFILAGGPRHPGGTMAEMLAHPDWVMAHLLMLGGFISFGAALFQLQRGSNGRTTARWVGLAAAATVLQAIEMAVHTASVVDVERLVAGHATPVLTTHLWMSILIYPVFGAATAGFIVTAARERRVASPAIAWLGVAGVLAHGLAAPLVVGFELLWARILFPAVVLFAFWSILAALWPARAKSAAPAAV